MRGAPFLIVLVLAGTAVAKAGPLDDDLLVVDLALGPHTLSEGMLAVLGPSEAALPLDEVVRALGFPIRVDSALGVAEGWFLEENRRFALDVGRGEVLVEGRPAPFDAARVEIRAEGLFVATSLLAAWFPVRFELDVSRLRVGIRSLEPLPVEQGLERRARWRRLGTTGADAPRRPAERPAYRLLDWPAVDQQLRLSFGRRPGQTGEPRMRYDALLAGDFLGLEAELALGLASGEGDDLFAAPEARALSWRLGRSDPDGGLLGFLQATHYRFGDVFAAAQPLIAPEHEARGFTVTNRRLDAPLEYDRVTLRGESLPGWDVELYRNEDLIAFQVVAEDGRWEFADVPLLYGFNLLRVLAYGPRGERHETVERFFVGPEMLGDGRGSYRFAVQDAAEGNEEAPAGTSTRLLADAWWRFGRDLSLAGRFSRLPSATGAQESYAGLGLRVMRWGLFTTLDLAVEPDGWAGSWGLRTRLGGWRLRLEGERFDGFTSRVTGFDDPLVRRDHVLLEGSLFAASSQPWTLRLAGRDTRQRSGARRTELTVGGSTRLAGLSLSTALRLARRREALDEPFTEAGGQVLVSRRARRWLLRADLGWEALPRAAFGGVELSADWSLGAERRLQLRLRRSLEPKPSWRYEAGLHWGFDRLGLGVAVSYETGGRAQTHLTLTTGVGRHPLARHYRASPRPVARQGSAVVRVFLDHDLNGRWNAGDEPLPGVRLRGVAGRSTADDGTVLVTGLPVHEPVALDLEIASLEDPAWIPRRPGVTVLPRPGRVATVDFPVVASGEVDGTVYLRRGDGLAEASRVRLELLDAAGEVSASVETVFDGFYLFERVDPGRYVLRVAPRQAERLGLAAPAERELVVGEGEVVSGVDFVLELSKAPSQRGLPTSPPRPSLPRGRTPP